MYRALTAALVTIGVLASVLTAAGAAGQSATKQRIAIEERFDPVNRTGTWRVTALTPGPIQSDSGKLTLSGGFRGTAMRNGARVALIVGTKTLTGKGGTLTLSQRVDSTDVWVGSGYSADVGTWKLTAATGAYSGLEGGGRFAGVGVLRGTVFVRQEGWVSR
jgi:hypothetical protein